jgi:DNA-binding PadR family transcriptional regulator
LSSDSLTPFSHVVLVLVGSGGAGPHDLVRMARQGPLYAEFAPSQWYAEPKRLARLGYLEARTEPGRTRPRTHYTLTEQGRDALRAWMREPSRFTKTFMEPAIRLLAADLVGDEAVLGSLRPLREEIAAHLARLDEGDRIAAGLPHRERYLRLNHALARRIVQAHAEWLDEVERELGGAGGGADAAPPPEPPTS